MGDGRGPEHARRVPAASTLAASPLFAGIALGEEWIAGSAKRFLKCEGATFTGWVVHVGDNYTDPIPTKRQALRALRDMAADRIRETYCGKS